MSAESETEAWLYENLPAIERGIAEFEEVTGTKPGIVFLLASRTDVLCMSLNCLDDVMPDACGHPAVVEILDRHKAGVYLDESGKPFDVPIICEAATVYRTSVETLKLKRKLQAAGAIVVARSSVTTTSPSTTSPPKHRFKQRKRRR
jgi:hypothetical protein